MRVAGVDCSISRTGIARPDGTLCSVRATTLPRDSPLDDRAERLLVLAYAILAEVPPEKTDLVVFEGYALGGARGMGAAYTAELGGLLRAELRASGLALLELPPSSLKKWSTGHGRASKDDMVRAARERKYSPRNHDEADAALLREYGLEVRA